MLKYNTIKLLDYTKKYNLDILLKEAYNQGTILVGKSAGAILLSKEGLSDSYILRNEKNTYEFINGINIVNIKICPHYTEEKKNIIQKRINIQEKVYGIPNSTAIIIKNNKIEKIETNKHKIEIIER